jgi:hypothetical protein
MTSTLGELRDRLNDQLGVEDASEKPWGTVAQRNSAIRFGFEQLEPTMMRLITENLTPLTDTREYPLTSRITKVVLVESITSTGLAQDVKNYRSWTVDGATSVVLAATPSIDSSLRVTGYAPYVTDLTADDDACDVPPDEEWIPLLGALAELYRRRFHEWLDFERYNASNPTTTIDPDTLYRAYTDAMARFEQAKSEHMRKVATSRRSSFERG